MWIRNKKPVHSILRTGLYLYVLKELLPLCVSLIEFINTTCCINKLHLTSVEWVRCVGNLEFYNRVLNAINLDGLLCVRA